MQETISIICNYTVFSYSFQLRRLIFLLKKISPSLEFKTIIFQNESFSNINICICPKVLSEREKSWQPTIMAKMSSPPPPTSSLLPPYPTSKTEIFLA